MYEWWVWDLFVGTMWFLPLNPTYWMKWVFLSRPVHSDVRRTLFSHRICGWGIKSPTTPLTPNIHPPALPTSAPSSFSFFFGSQSSLKNLTLHLPLCISAQRQLTRRYPAGTHSKLKCVLNVSQLALLSEWVYMQMQEVFVFPPHPSKFLHSLGISGWESYSLWGARAWNAPAIADSGGANPGRLMNFFFIV